MEANEVKILDSLDWYKLIIHTYKIVKYAQCKTHKHHIKPKCLYPELVDDYQNIIEVPEIVHWALHELLFDYYKQTSNKEAVSKLQKVNLEYFINECLRGASHFGPIKLYDFSKRD